MSRATGLVSLFMPLKEVMVCFNLTLINTARKRKASEIGGSAVSSGLNLEPQQAVSARVRTSTKQKTREADKERAKRQNALVGSFSNRAKSNVKPKFSQKEMLLEALDTEVVTLIITVEYCLWCVMYDYDYFSANERQVAQDSADGGGRDRDVAAPRPRARKADR